MGIKEKFQWSREPLYLIDGTSFLYRAFYAYPDLKRSDGFPTNAIYILTRLLLRILREDSPNYACFLLDGSGPTFRHQIFESYKSQRLQMPESLGVQIEPIKQGVRLLGLGYLETSEYEVDDYICSISEKFKDQNPIVIIASDKDLKQCLDHNVLIWDPGQSSEKIITWEDFLEEEDLNPYQWPDFLALVGDKSDNIPGVPGIGPKSARNILKQFSGIETLQKHYQELPLSQQKKLSPYLQELTLYRKLNQLCTDLNIKNHIQEFQNSLIDYSELQAFFESYEFRSLIKELPFAQNSESVQNWDKEVSVERLTLKNYSQLPDLAGKELGLAIDREQTIYLGIDQKEYLYKYLPSNIPAELDKAIQIFTPDYKALLKKHPEFWYLPERLFFDLGLASYLINPEEKNYQWERLLQLHLPEIGLHADNQGQAALRIGKLLRERVHNSNLLDLLYSLEIPLTRVLVNMETRGVKVDLQELEKFLQEVENKIQKLSAHIYTRAGMEFNLRSNPQMAEVLFSKLGLKPGRRTPGGAPSTANNVLETLKHQHPIIEDILQFRSLEKLRSTYLAPLSKLVDTNHRLHSTFNQLATATGRLSSSNPNLQNIPIRGEFGPRMRSCFIASSGKVLLAADYSQIELRILAHMSKDSQLLEAFEQAEDIHNRTAALLFDKRQNSVTEEERRKAKTINFGLIYGMGPQKLSRELNIRMQKAQEFIGLYFSRLQKVSNFFEKVEQQAKEKGFVTTIAGRRRFLKDINSRNQNLAEQAKRIAVNTLIQGSAADIIKLAMLECENSELLRDKDTQLILQVHDELLFEIPEKNVHEAGEIVSEIMSKVFSLNVPLTAKWGFGKNWAKAH